MGDFRSELIFDHRSRLAMTGADRRKTAAEELARRQKPNMAWRRRWASAGSGWRLEAPGTTRNRPARSSWAPRRISRGPPRVIVHPATPALRMTSLWPSPPGWGRVGERGPYSRAIARRAASVGSQNRYRLRYREAVRGPSTRSRCSLAQDDEQIVAAEYAMLRSRCAQRRL